MTVTINRVIEDGPIHFDLDSGTASCARTVRIDGDQLENYLDDLCGATFIDGWGWTYGVRAQHPVYSWLRFSGIEGTGFPAAPDDAATTYPQLDVAVKYLGECLNINKGADDPDPPTGTYLAHERQSGVEVMTLPDSTFTWQSSNEPVHNVNPGKVIPTTTHRFTWSNVGVPPWTQIDERIGCVNSNAEFGWPAECALFASWDYQLTYNATGEITYQFTYVFLERRIRAGATTYGWNHFYRDDVTEDNWQRLQVAGGTDYVYDTVDFAPLFWTW